QLLPVMRRQDIDPDPARRFNRVVVERARAGRLYGHLASPVTGGGIPVDEYGIMTLAALHDGACGDPTAAARHGLFGLARLGRRRVRGNRPIDDDSEAIAFLAERMKPVIAEAFPVWRRLGIL